MRTLIVLAMMLTLSTPALAERRATVPKGAPAAPQKLGEADVLKLRVLTMAEQVGQLQQENLALREENVALRKALLGQPRADIAGERKALLEKAGVKPGQQVNLETGEVVTPPEPAKPEPEKK